MEIPEIRYARTAEGIHVAYQTVGDGPLDIVFSSEWISHCEVQWEHPIVGSALHRLATFGRHQLRQTRNRAVGSRLHPRGAKP